MSRIQRIGDGGGCLLAGRSGHTCALCGCCCSRPKAVCDECDRTRLGLVRHTPPPLPPLPPPPALGIPACYLMRMPPVLRQGRINACAVNAVANALACQLRRTGDTRAVSRMFMYYVARYYVARYYVARYHVAARHSVRDEGCSLRDVCRAVATYGACDERDWPYSRDFMARRPPKEVFSAARALLPDVKCEVMPQTLHSFVGCLVRGYPIVLGMSIFTNIRAARLTGVLDMPKPGDVHLGGHAVVVCGYDMGTRLFRVQNCWGTEWGDEGFLSLPFEYVVSPTLCWDIWVVRVARVDHVK